MNPDTENITFKVRWVSKDQKMVFGSPARFNVLHAGRRWGKTRGAFVLMCDMLLREKPINVLWVDTTQRNIDLYFEEHVTQILPQGLYHWARQPKILKIKNGSVAHFGSVQHPENLEGFSYDYIFLNEAGIILKGEAGERLWRNTIRPMAIEARDDGGKCKVWFVGTPKGLGLFSEFAKRGRSDAPEDKDWATFHRTSYDRKAITQEEIAELVREIPGGRQSRVFRQEILAEFLKDDDADPVISYELGSDSFARKRSKDDSIRVFWGVDPSLGGDDSAAIAKRQGQVLLEPVSLNNDKELRGDTGAMWVKEHYDSCSPDEIPDKIFVDVIGLGDSWFTWMRSMGLPVVDVNWSTHAVARDKYHRLRDEMWFKTAKWLETGSIAGDMALMLELVKPVIDKKWLDEKGIYKVESKVNMKKRLGADGRSPNRADAFILTMAAGIERKTRHSQPGYGRKNKFQGETTWMSA